MNEKIYYSANEIATMLGISMGTAYKILREMVRSSEGGGCIMSCSAKKDSNGTWSIQYRWTDWIGTKKKSQKRGVKTKKEAEEWYAHFILQQSSDPTMTLNGFWGIYRADTKKRFRKTIMK